jgi:hypothetical protein
LYDNAHDREDSRERRLSEASNNSYDKNEYRNKRLSDASDISMDEADSSVAVPDNARVHDNKTLRNRDNEQFTSIANLTLNIPNTGQLQAHNPPLLYVNISQKSADATADNIASDSLDFGNRISGKSPFISPFKRQMNRDMRSTNRFLNQSMDSVEGNIFIQSDSTSPPEFGSVVRKCRSVLFSPGLQSSAQTSSLKLGNNSSDGHLLSAKASSYSRRSTFRDFEQYLPSSPKHHSDHSMPPSQSTTPDADNRYSSKLAQQPVTGIYLLGSKRLNRKERRQLRSGLRAMVMTMIQYASNGESEIKHIMTFLAVCKDLALLDEVSQAVLCLLVEGGDRIMVSITEACCGPEEFASFILQRLITCPSEDVRCSGIRLLTHYYLRVDSLPYSVITLSLKGYNNNILIRTIEKFSSITGEQQEMQRLQASGGLTLLCEWLSPNMSSSTTRTYSALLEMLLTKPGAKNQVSVQYTHFSTDNFIVSSSALTAPSTHTPVRDNLKKTYSYREESNNRDKTVVFVAHYLQPDKVHDDDSDMTNGVIIPVFLELLPLMSLPVQKQVISDMLALLKHSEGNRDAFCSNVIWHRCMYRLVAKLIAPEPDCRSAPLTTGDMCHYLVKHSRAMKSSSRFRQIDCYKYDVVAGKIIKVSSSESRHAEGEEIRNVSPFRAPSDTSTTNQASAGRLLRTWSNCDSDAGSISSQSTFRSIDIVGNESDPEMWFALGIKLYATLLGHALLVKGGWCELVRMISLAWSDISIQEQKRLLQLENKHMFNTGDAFSSFELYPESFTSNGRCVSQAILSHLINEKTFTMRRTYDELKSLLRSKDTKKNIHAMNCLENILTLFAVSAEFTLDTLATTTLNLPDFHVARLRVHVFKEVKSAFFV